MKTAIHAFPGNADGDYKDREEVIKDGERDNSKREREKGSTEMA